MTFANRLKAAKHAPLLLTESRSGSRPDPAYGLKPIFFGPNGLRAGWRLLIFLALLGVPAASLLFIARSHASGRDQITITPFLMGANEVIVLLILCVVTWIMGKI